MEGDLRNLSYFLNIRKELEFNNWNSADLQYLATLVRGKVTKTKELQGNSQSWKGNEGPFTYWRHFEQQWSWSFCRWELKMLVPLHGLFCSTWKFYHIFCLFFCDFPVPILTWANQPKWKLYFFLHEGHSALVQKNYQTKPCHIGTFIKCFSSLWPMCTEIWHST